RGNGNDRVRGEESGESGELISSRPQVRNRSCARPSREKDDLQGRQLERGDRVFAAGPRNLDAKGKALRWEGSRDEVNHRLRSQRADCGGRPRLRLSGSLAC